MKKLRRKNYYLNVVLEKKFIKKKIKTAHYSEKESNQQWRQF